MHHGRGILLGLALSATASPALAQCEQARLDGPDPVANTFFGFDVDLAPGLAAIGQASLHGIGAWPAGAVHLYVPVGETWVLEQSVTAAGGAPMDAFGYAVATDGERLVVGAHGDDDAGEDAGAVYVFERFFGGLWVQTAKLVPPEPAEGMHLGTSVALSGERIVAGSDRADVAGLYSGTAFVFERHAGSWEVVAQLAPPDHAADDAFGVAVAIDGSTAVVGAYGEGALDSGAAHVFETDGTDWSHVARLEGSDTSAWDNFGFAVALEGERLVVGAPYHDLDAPGGTLHSAGAAYVFERSGGAWSETAKLVSAAALFGGSLGNALDIDGDRIAAGARGHAFDIDGLGSASVFELRAGTWVEVARLTASDGDYADNLGWAVAIERETVLAASPWIEMLTSNRGRAYFFDAFGCGPGLPFCFGDGCPCGNDDLLGGCANSGGAGARLVTEGSASLAAGDLELLASLLPAGEPVLFVQGEGLAGGGAGTPFFDGLLCAGGTLVRLELGRADSAGHARTSFDLGAAGGVLAGDSRSYQAWYRDPAGPCGSGANLSNAYQLRWRP